MFVILHYISKQNNYIHHCQWATSSACTEYRHCKNTHSDTAAYNTDTNIHIYTHTTGVVVVECRTCDQEVAGSSLGRESWLKNSGQVSMEFLCEKTMGYFCKGVHPGLSSLELTDLLESGMSLRHKPIVLFSHHDTDCGRFQNCVLYPRTWVDEI